MVKAELCTKATGKSAHRIIAGMRCDPQLAKAPTHSCLKYESEQRAANTLLPEIRADAEGRFCGAFADGMKLGHADHATVVLCSDHQNAGLHASSYISLDKLGADMTVEAIMTCFGLQSSQVTNELRNIGATHNTQHDVKRGREIGTWHEFKPNGAMHVTGSWLASSREHDAPMSEKNKKNLCAAQFVKPCTIVGVAANLPERDRMNDAAHEWMRNSDTCRNGVGR
jgi:hypothetical protein